MMSHATMPKSTGINSFKVLFLLLPSLSSFLPFPLLFFLFPFFLLPFYLIFRGKKTTGKVVRVLALLTRWKAKTLWRLEDTDHTISWCRLWLLM